MERLIKYFDQMKADEDLKEKTRTFLWKTIAANEKNVHMETYPSQKKQTALRRIAMTAAPIAACFVLAIGGYAFYKTPIEYISYDINPSLELGLNYFGRIVEAEGFNAEGTRLLAECRIQDLTAEDAVKALTMQAKEDGYIKEDGTTVIALTAEAKRIQNAERLENMLREVTQRFIDENGLQVMIYTDRVELQIRTEAREYGLSPGKYKLIQMLGSLDPYVDPERYRNTRITEILLRADELLSKNGNTQTDESKWNFEMIRDTALKIENAYQENDKNRNQNQVKTTSPSAISPAQEQNRNQSQVQNQMPDAGTSVQNQMQNGQQISGTSSSAIEQVQNQNQNQEEGQAAAAEEKTPNQNSDAGTSGADGGQSSQSQSDGGQGSSHTENSSKPK